MPPKVRWIQNRSMTMTKMRRWILTAIEDRIDCCLLHAARAINHEQHCKIKKELEINFPFEKQIKCLQRLLEIGSDRLLLLLWIRKFFHSKTKQIILFKCWINENMIYFVEFSCLLIHFLFHFFFIYLFVALKDSRRWSSKNDWIESQPQFSVILNYYFELNLYSHFICDATYEETEISEW